MHLPLRRRLLLRHHLRRVVQQETDRPPQNPYRNETTNRMGPNKINYFPLRGIQKVDFTKNREKVVVASNFY